MHEDPDDTGTRAALEAACGACDAWRLPWIASVRIAALDAAAYPEASESPSLCAAVSSLVLHRFGLLPLPLSGADLDHPHNHCKANVDPDTRHAIWTTVAACLRMLSIEFDKEGEAGAKVKAEDPAKYHHGESNPGRSLLC